MSMTTDVMMMTMKVIYWRLVFGNFGEGASMLAIQG